ncbi:hypothetical protein GC722_10235 [Auraticoccus sp. F435]|uniref:YbaB/EbfC family DNA-binding protein n=1 Tax=Auraticoccus cholistanensis TaxID=2656650 RepID=A0A6A9UUP8_9ACTN|nr:YbaB/EbfC family nucleoid-associated protein [Auraticoccus cholistanensis]MVA76398.1 hypothetical protein [Auraticoccus cholistanensis]
MHQPSPPSGPQPAGAPDPRDPLLDAVEEITARSWTATSGGGEVTAVVGGDQRLRTVDVLRPDLPAGLLGARIAEAVNAALRLAREETVRAMGELPRIGPELRRLAGGHGA